MQLHVSDGPGALRQADVPIPYDVLVDVRAIGISYRELMITQGRYQLTPTLPFVPGSEIAGVVHSAPAGSGWQPGDRVAAFVWSCSRTSQRWASPGVPSLTATRG